MSLSHLDSQGRARMVDVGQKPDTERTAVAVGEVLMLPTTLALIRAGQIKKGDVLTVAQLAGVMAAKRTAELIPLCHPLALTQIEVTCELRDDLPGVAIRATVKTTGKTGVEMEALTAVSVAALTIYDMAKAAEKTMTITNVRLVEKRGGKSDFDAAMNEMHETAQRYHITEQDIDDEIRAVREEQARLKTTQLTDELD